MDTDVEEEQVEEESHSEKSLNSSDAPVSSYNKNWIYEFFMYNLQFTCDELITTKVNLHLCPNLIEFMLLQYDVQIFIEAIQIVNIINKLNMFLFIV